MLGPQKNILWSRHTPLPYNPYPLFQVPNFSLCNETSNLAIFVPLLFAERNVKEVDKKEADLPIGGKNLSLVKSKQLKGQGLAAFQHPIKVAKARYIFLIEILLRV